MAFELTPIPVWVLDMQSLYVVWANTAAIVFWHAENLEELCDRQILHQAPEPVLVRLRNLFARIVTGEVVQEDWTFVPGNIPQPKVLRAQAILLEDGRTAMLNQVTNLDEHTSATTLRTLAMVRHAKATSVLVDEHGIILSKNAGATTEFGDTDGWANWFVDANTAQEILLSALAGNTIELEVPVQTRRGQRVHTIIAHALRDPATGKLAVLVQHFDVTERIDAERQVEAHLATLRQQQRDILELSTPFLDVGAHTLALPIIGRIDEARAAEMNMKLLRVVAERSIERVILDITGVASVEKSNVAFLRRLVSAVALLGAKPIVTGIRSDLARMLAISDESLSGITIKRSLADGLAVSYRNARPQ